MKVNLLAFAAVIALASANVKISNFDAAIDISSQILKGSSVITFINEGEAVSAVTFALSEEESEGLSYIQATENKMLDVKLKITKDSATKAGFASYKITLAKPLAKGESIVLKVEYRVTQILTPLPAKITQLENQFVVYEGSAYVAAAYPVITQKTTIKLSQGKLNSFTNVSPSTKESNRVNYGPYENQEAYVNKPIKVHYENNSPFIVATQVDRLIEISQWGNIAVEENIQLVNVGAKLEGAFSRLDFQLDRRGSKMPALQKYLTVLPAAAKDIYYRDVIGNISTSDVKLRKNSVDVEIQPRFPLFGGWKTTYTIGYNLPSHAHLYKKENQFVLKMKFLDHILDNLVVEKLSTKVVLPETASNVKIATPYSVERRPDEHIATYLDTTGRTVIVLQKQNLVDNHIQYFTMSYDFDATNMFREPLMASAAFFILFLSIIVYVRFDFTIVADASKDARDRLQGKIDQLASLLEKRYKIYEQIITAAAHYKTNRDESVLAQAKTKADKSRQEINEQIANLLSAIKLDSTETYEKAQEVVKVDKSVHDAEATYISAVKKSTTKNGPEDKAHSSKLCEAHNRVENILANL